MTFTGRSSLFFWGILHFIIIAVCAFLTWKNNASFVIWIYVALISFTLASYLTYLRDHHAIITKRYDLTKEDVYMLLGFGVVLWTLYIGMKFSDL